MSGERELREELVKACKVLYASKAAGDGLGGHVSARLDSERMLIKPRLLSWTALRPDDLIVMEMNEVAGQSKSVLEWPIHARIYAARPEVQCVVHAHPVASTLMAALGITVEPLDQDCAALTDRAPVLENGAVSISTVERGDEVARALGAHVALLIKNHGSVVAGASIAEVCVTAHKLEKVAETMLRAATLVNPPLMTEERKAAILAARKGVESASMIDERWRMLQEYFLATMFPGCVDD